jgi:hypothetical protein
MAGLTVIHATPDEIQALIQRTDRPIRFDTSEPQRHLGLAARQQ